VLSEGARALVGGTVEAHQLESMEEMVEAVIALCDCGEEDTGKVFVSLDLVADWKLDVRGLDGRPRTAGSAP
jgi:hypothetical protein